MIVTVTPNPAVDVTIAAAQLPLGESLAIDTARRRAGGKGLNVARVLAQTGHAVTATGPAGADDLAWMADDLAGVHTAFTPCTHPTRTTYALVETDAGRTTQLNERGAARTADEWDAVITAATGAAATASCLTISGSLPPQTPDDVIGRLVAAGRAAGALVIADLSGPALQRACHAGADVVAPNRAELHATCGTSDPREGAAMLQDAGAGLVLVTLGEDGLVAVPRTGTARHARLARPLRGNPTGAGDALVAAVAAAVDDGDGPDADDITSDAWLRQAVAWSAAAVLAPQAGRLDPSYPHLVDDVVVRAL